MAKIQSKYQIYLQIDVFSSELGIIFGPVRESVQRVEK